jgi:lysophospholipase L1-like esterase
MAFALIAPPAFAAPTSVQPGRYVALGDSFSAGQGTGVYAGPPSGLDALCFRSTQADAPLLLADPVVPQRFDFGACGGAVINDYYQPRSVNHPADPITGEPAQQTRLDASTTLVTISMGGNDAGFSNVLTNCVNIPLIHPTTDNDCFGPQVEANLQALLYGNATTPGLGSRLTALYQDIRARAPQARILVLGYPRLFPQAPQHGCLLYEVITGTWIEYLSPTRLTWLNSKGTELDAVIKQSVAASGVAEYVDGLNAMTDSQGVEHQACGDAPAWINPLQTIIPLVPTRPGAVAQPGSTPTDLVKSESFHPNAAGYQALATVFQAAIAAGPPPGVHVPVAGRAFQLRPTTSDAPALSWEPAALPGVQSGLLVVRYDASNAPPSVLPNPTAPLPADATAFEDDATLSSTEYCYVLAVLGWGGILLGNSDALCVFPHTGSATGAPAGLALQLDQSNVASLSWASATGQDGYVLVRVALQDSPPVVSAVSLPAAATSASDNTGGAPTCYVLVATRGGQQTGNSDILCGLPGLAQLPGVTGIAAAASRFAAPSAARTMLPTTLPALTPSVVDSVRARLASWARSGAKGAHRHLRNRPVVRRPAS